MTSSASTISSTSVNEELEEDVSMSEHLFSQFRCFTDPNVDVKRKVEVSKQFQPYLQELDGYLSFSSSSGGEGEAESTANASTTGTTTTTSRRTVSCQLPVLDWNTHFRKAYTLLLWIRPVLGGEIQTTILEDDQNAMKGLHRRILYRFATAPDDASASGVCVTIGDWRVIEHDDDDGDDDDDDDNDSDTIDAKNNNKHNRKKPLLVHTQLSAYSLPYTSPFHADGTAAMINAGNISSYVTAPLELEEGRWSLVGISHVYPYLKRPYWTLCVNGRVRASGELAYPTLDRTPVMNFNTIFEDPLKGGCTFIAAEPPEIRRPDFAKKASDLQNQVHPRHVLKLHLASYCLCNELFSPTIQALLAQAGPNMSLRSHGAIPMLPPVANWSKGASLEGPNVGIPLVVHGQALMVQQLGATCILWGSAADARLLGRAHSEGGTKQRIVCHMPPRRGATYNAPRVGLIQPTPPASMSSSARSAVEVSPDQDPVSMTIVGECSIHHNLSNYLLQSSQLENVDTQLFATSKYFSLLLLDGQGLDSHILLPFFLALPPPGTAMEMQTILLTNSLQHLFDLFTNQAEFACHLIHLLAISIDMGGGRWQEHLLQNGSLHILTSTLRQALIRAEHLHVDEYSSYTEFVKAQAVNTDSNNANNKTQMTMKKKMKTPISILPKSPSKIPLTIAHAMSDLISVCCGPRSAYLEDLDPSMQIQRTSDLALTALFAIGLDWELWGRNLPAAEIILNSVASRYGGGCVTAGYILRSQISVQFFLDTLQEALQRHEQNYVPSDSDQPSALERVANSCAHILQAMLLSSLSNTRSISQGEHDIGACMGALSDCPLGSVGAHVIFTAIMGVLRWCDVLNFAATTEPTGKAAKDYKRNNLRCMASPRIDDDHKSKVATRLGRNLLMSQYHDVVAPMLLSRTVFSGERTMSMENSSLPLDWEHHWRLGLAIFSWATTLAGPEGMIAAKSMGSLLLASGLAGSLGGAMSDATKVSVQHLFLPPPTMALTMAASSRKFNEWSYTDLLSDRLEVMMPLLPGLVVSLVSHPSDAEKSHDKLIPTKALVILAELLTAVGGSFYRVFGGQTHSTGSSGYSSKGGGLKWNNRPTDSSAVQAAKAYIPHLLVVVMVLEHHISLRNEISDGKAVSILDSPAVLQQGADDDSWVEVSSRVNESFLSDGTIKLPDGMKQDTIEAVVVCLQICQRSMLTTISELMTNSMRTSGGEVATMLWRNVLVTLHESSMYAAKTNQSETPESKGVTQNNVLCRLAAMVLNKSLKRDYQWELWHPELGSGVSRLCLLIEEKELLLRSAGTNGEYSRDQVLLLCALLSVLKYGRDTTGWCQLILPTPPGPMEDEHRQMRYDAAPATSKVMLPVLQPALRSVMECAGNLGSAMTIKVPQTSTEKSDLGKTNEVGLLEYIIQELRETLMAAIVGMSFANARDIALHAMATLRRSIHSYKNSNDSFGIAQCELLLCMVAEEVRVRYEGERRRRETALFDAYEQNETQESKEAQAAAIADSHAIESMILGGELIPPAVRSQKEPIEEITFDHSETPGDIRPSASEDFVVFNDGLAVSGTGDHNVAKMQWSQYEGLSAALEECSSAAAKNSDGNDQPSISVKSVLETLAPFLDAWDENAAKDAAESELVKLFDFGLHSNSDGKSESENVMQLQGSETAADSMSTFIELAAAEERQ